jgi:hypothetical protein
MGSWKGVDGDVIHMLQPHTGISQAPGDRLGREACPVLDPTETLLLHGPEDLPIADEGRRGIGMEGIDTENERHRGRRDRIGQTEGA